MIYIVGLGPGSYEYMLSKAIDVLKESDLIIGFKRGISSIDFIDKEKVCIKSLKDIEPFLKQTQKRSQ